MDKLTIIGSGAMGSLYAAFLEAHTDLIMLSHWPEQIEAIRAHGLVCSHARNRETRHHIAVTDNPRDLYPIATALIVVKSYQTARAAYEIAPLLTPDGIAVTMQNGLGNFEILESALGRGRVAQGVTAQGATLLGPGFVKHAGAGPTSIATIAGKEGRIAEVTALLNKAGMPTEMAADVRSLQWGKLAVNAGINPLTAYLGVRNGYLVQSTTARKIMCAAAEETAAVAQALGISLPYASASERVIEVAASTAENKSSMLQDVMRGAPTEIDAINGAVASNGREVGQPTPINDALWRLMRSRQEFSGPEPTAEEKMATLKMFLEEAQ